MKVTYHKSVVQTIEKEILSAKDVETGGVLLGSIGEEGIAVVKATGPGPNAIRESYFFKADNNYVKMLIDIEYANTNGEVQYVGEWHSHPQKQPTPSDEDIKSIREIANSFKKTVLLLIIGAIDFKQSVFLNQSISIIKSPM